MFLCSFVAALGNIIIIISGSPLWVRRQHSCDSCNIFLVFFLNNVFVFLRSTCIRVLYHASRSFYSNICKLGGVMSISIRSKGQLPFMIAITNSETALQHTTFRKFLLLSLHLHSPSFQRHYRKLSFSLSLAESAILCRPSLFPRLSETALIQGGPSFQAFVVAQNYLKHQHAYCQTSALATTNYLYAELTASIMNKHGEILLGLVDPWRMPCPSPTVTVHVWLDHGGLEGVSLMCP